MMEATTSPEMGICAFHKKVTPVELITISVGSRSLSGHYVEITDRKEILLCGECAHQVRTGRMFLMSDLVTFTDGSGEPISSHREIFL